MAGETGRVGRYRSMHHRERLSLCCGVAVLLARDCSTVVRRCRGDEASSGLAAEVIEVVLDSAAQLRC